MAIVESPASLSLSGNLKDIIVSGVLGPIDFELKKGSIVVLSETYQPDNAQVVQIKLKDLIDSLLEIEVPDFEDAVFHQTKGYASFTATVEGEDPITFTVVKGGIDLKFPDASNILQSNWLTWQPQQKLTKYYTPEWLTHYATASTTVKVKAYFSDGTDDTKTLATLPSGQLSTINVNYGLIDGKFTKQPIYFDVWTEVVGTRKSFVQRYILDISSKQDDDVFVFANTFGGVDTITFVGEKRYLDSFDVDSALYDEITKEYFSTADKHIQKNTGYFRDERSRIWSLEFFASNYRFAVVEGALRRILVAKPDLEASHGSLASYEFNYQLAEQTKYLNLSRQDDLPEDLEIIGPDNEVFFLAPRLNEFATASDLSDIIFPVQLPYEEEWLKLTFAQIEDHLAEEVRKRIPTPDLSNFYTKAEIDYLLEESGGGGKEKDTLQTVTNRGATSTKIITVKGTRNESLLSVPAAAPAPETIKAGERYVWMGEVGSGIIPPPSSGNLSGLNDVNLVGLVDGQALTYNALTGKWENKAISIDLSGYVQKIWLETNYYNKVESDGRYVTQATDQLSLPSNKGWSGRHDFTGAISIPTSAPTVPVAGRPYIWMGSVGSTSPLPPLGNLEDLTNVANTIANGKVLVKGLDGIWTGADFAGTQTLTTPLLGQIGITGGNTVDLNALKYRSDAWNSLTRNVGYFNYSAVGTPDGSAVHGIHLPHSDLNYGTSLVFRNNRGWFQSLENGVLQPWLEIATLDKTVNLTGNQTVAGEKTLTSLTTINTGSGSGTTNMLSLSRNGGYINFGNGTSTGSQFAPRIDFITNNHTANGALLYVSGSDSYSGSAFILRAYNSDKTGGITSGNLINIQNQTTSYFRVNYAGVTTIPNLSGTGNGIVGVTSSGQLTRTNVADFGYVPYTGATSDVDLNTKRLTLNGLFYKKGNTLQKTDLTGGTGTVAFNRYDSPVAIASTSSSLNRDIVITLPELNTSTVAGWVAEVMLYSPSIAAGLEIPVKLTISARNPSAASRAVSATGAVELISEVRFGRIDNSPVLIIKRSGGNNVSYMRAELTKFYTTINPTPAQDIKSNYSITLVENEADIIGFTYIGTITNAQFTRDSYYLDYNNLTNKAQLSLGTSAGNIAISGGNNVSLSSLIRDIRPVFSIQQPGGFYVYNLSSGGAAGGYPTQSGSGVLMKYNVPNNSNYQGSFSIYKGSINDGKLYFNVGGTSADNDWVGWQKFASEEWADNRFITQSTDQTILPGNKDWQGRHHFTGAISVPTAAPASPVSGQRYIWIGSVGTSTLPTAWSLSGADDVALSSLSNGQFLRYNAVTGKWYNDTFNVDLTAYATKSWVAAGYSPLGHTHAIADVSGLQTALDAKQATLVSGSNIKTINGVSVVGSGNIVTPNTTYTAGVGLTLTTAEFSANFGTTAGTVAQGNDSRILNGQTAFTWGNHSLAGYATQTWSDGRYVTQSTDQLSLPGNKGWTGKHHFTGAISIPQAAPTSPTAGQAYIWIGTVGSSVLPTAWSLAGADDTSIASLVNGQVLTYNAIAGKWENKTLAIDLSSYATQSWVSAGFSPIGHTHTIANITGLQSELDGKQATLVSGTNIKTINGVSILGSGNIVTDSYSAGTGLTLSAGVFSADFGTTAGKIAQGNDSRILNGQTAYSWGNHASAGYITTVKTINGVSILGSGNIVTPNTTYTAGTGLSLTGTTFAVNFGTTAGTVVQGNDSRIQLGVVAYSYGDHRIAGYVDTYTVQIISALKTFSAGITVPAKITANVVEATALIMPTAAPTSPETGKRYVWIS